MFVGSLYYKQSQVKYAVICPTFPPPPQKKTKKKQPRYIVKTVFFHQNMNKILMEKHSFHKYILVVFLGVGWGGGGGWTNTESFTCANNMNPDQTAPRGAV